jgi:hypothetical protein
MNVTCICDTCLYGFAEDRSCYKGGIDKCLKKDVYTLYINKESDKARAIVKEIVDRDLEKLKSK